jgi:hydrogenase-1 operon protein HyaF
MPVGMATYRAPFLPEPAELTQLTAALATLRALHQALTRAAQTGVAESLSLAGIPGADLRLIGQVLGEGEVSALVRPRGLGAASLQVQESALTGVFRVAAVDAAGCMSERLEVGALPPALLEHAARDGQRRGSELSTTLPEGLMNAPALLSELRAHWQADTSALASPHVINLSLLPLSGADVQHLADELGRGTVTLLSRGYGNCRISSTERPATWRVTYYNSEDTPILDTLEVSRVPEVACAARQDLEESAVRLAELLAWLEQA